MSDEPLDHIRRADLPWRVDGLTECGRPVADVVSVVSRDDVVAKVKRLGKQRAAFSTCMTCAGNSKADSFLDNPIQVVRRECERMGFYDDGEKAQQFRRELLALAALVAEHRDEFDEMVGGLDDVVDLRDARRQKNRPYQFGRQV